MGIEKNRGLLLLLSGYIGLLAIGITGAFTVGTTLERIWMIVALLAIGILFSFTHTKTKKKLESTIFMAVQTVLAGSLIMIDPGGGLFPIIFFILAAQVMIDFSFRAGVLWLLLFSLISAVGFFSANGISGIFSLLPYVAGFTFFGLFGKVMVDAQHERERSERLLADLQAAHEKLQSYTQKVEDLAVAEERNRIAREMHDNLGHRLTIASVQLEGAQRLIYSNPQKVDQILGTVREQVRDGLADLRRTVALLRTPVDEALPLPQALTRLADQVREATGIIIHLSIEDALPELPGSHRQAIFRAAQEGLTNIQRHAHASEAWLYLYVQDRQVTLLVGDNGIGIPADHLRNGFGLTGLQERAALLNGELHIDPRPGGGSQLSFRLPLGEEPIP